MSKSQMLLDKTARLKALEDERASYEAVWREISEYQQPMLARFYVEDFRRGERRDNNIFDNTATRAGSILQAGLMSGASNPASMFYDLNVPDPDLNRYRPVRRWLDESRERMNRVFNRSNTFRALPMYYGEMGAFGQGCGIIDPDFEHVVRHRPLTVGQYCIADNSDGVVDTLYREFQMTAGQLAHMFGLDRVSDQVRRMCEQNNGSAKDTPVTVIHAIEPRKERQVERVDSRNMPWQSVYFESGRTAPDDVLRESGYNDFPVVAPRWMRAANDVYGWGPGLVALGDVKQLQHQQLRKAEAIDYMSKPPLQGPAAESGDEPDWTPGAYTEVDQPGRDAGIRTLFESRMDLNALREDIADVRGRINAAYHADLFLMLYEQSKTMTAHEVRVRHAEKLMMLGPVLHSVNHELLEPMIDLTFNRMQERGLLPPPPPELEEGMPIDIEFISVLAQAQRASRATSLDRVTQLVAALREIDPAVVDKFDTDVAIDEYADLHGAPARVIRSTREVDEVRQARAAKQAAMEAAEAQNLQASTAKDVAQAVATMPQQLPQGPGAL